MNKLLLSVLGAIVVSATSSCTSKSQGQDACVSLHDSTVVSSDFGLPVAALLYKHYMFVSDIYGEEGFVKVLDLDNGRVVANLASQGEGPDEVRAVGSVDYASSATGDSLYVFDPVSKKIQTYPIDSLFAGKQVAPARTIKLPSDSQYMGVLKARKGYIASGFLPDKKFVWLDDALRECGSGGQYAPKPSEEISDMVHVMANNGKFFLSKDKQYVANIIYMAGILSCYSLHPATNTFSLEWENVLTELDYKQQDDSFVNQGRVGYLSVSMGNQYLYALYSGEKEQKDKPATYA